MLSHIDQTHEHLETETNERQRNISESFYHFYVTLCAWLMCLHNVDPEHSCTEILQRAVLFQLIKLETDLHTDKANSSSQERVEVTAASIDAALNPWADL